ncbi:hypothetical protein KEM48_004504 [Puccinia striiformis f. sp. tritici PST-130]|nr:hypothetical protein H4Q26_004176 [Puccinia striiformis f. sp. tritici PST-130]KAI9611354.1 hypothetical protein KEM48_004504 [Puccinia striiformis f. sp. tritici PST-130]
MQGRWKEMERSGNMRQVNTKEPSIVNKVVDEDQDKEALDLGIEDKKMIEALDLGNEDNKMIDKCLDLIQSQFGEEDEGDKESEERVLA